MNNEVDSRWKSAFSFLRKYKKKNDTKTTKREILQKDKYNKFVKVDGKWERVIVVEGVECYEGVLLQLKCGRFYYKPVFYDINEGNSL